MFQPAILIADDDAAFGATVAEALADRGLTTLWVDNGLEAVERLRLERYHLLVTDYHMPGLNGLDVLVQARRTGVITPPTILLSANLDQVLHAADAAAHRPDEMLPKPVGLARLLEAVQALLWRAHRWRPS